MSARHARNLHKPVVQSLRPARTKSVLSSIGLASCPECSACFATVSRPGDGVVWLALLPSLPVIYRKEALPAFFDMVSVGILGVLVYKFIQSRMLRPRPFAAHAEIHLGASPLDEYTFPSGHTPHSVAFTLVATSHYPELAWPMVPFTLLVATSRLVVRLHYPTDVLAGAAIGTLLAMGTLSS
jgi:undecaprenyl-diphosphatase